MVLGAVATVMGAVTMNKVANMGLAPQADFCEVPRVCFKVADECLQSTLYKCYTYKC